MAGFHYYDEINNKKNQQDRIFEALGSYLRTCQ